VKVDLISLKQICNYRDGTKKSIETVLLDALKLSRISGGDEIPNYRGIFQPKPD
jgi:hypothetical protein